MQYTTVFKFTASLQFICFHCIVPRTFDFPYIVDIRVTVAFNTTPHEFER